MTRPNYDRSAIARTTAANIQTLTCYTTNFAITGDIPLLVGTAMARPDYDGPATLRTAAANIQTFLPRISLAWPTFEKAANSTVTKIVAQTVFVTGASLTGISFCAPASEKCTPNALHSYSSFAHCSVSIGSGGPGKAGYPYERRKTRGSSLSVWWCWDTASRTEGNVPRA